jgi:hypothetical protein
MGRNQGGVALEFPGFQRQKNREDRIFFFEAGKKNGVTYIYLNKLEVVGLEPALRLLMGQFIVQIMKSI